MAALVAAGLAAFCLLSGLSYPGFPMSTAFWGVLAAATSITLAVWSTGRALLRGRERLRATAVLVLVALLLGAAVATARSDDGARRQARWAASQPAFEQEVGTAGEPVAVGGGPVYSGSFAPYHGVCPARIGEFRIVDCRSIDGGFLFLQAQDALTDDSGIVYLPADTRARSQGWSTETMSPLGEPWWSWTCHC